MNLQILSFFQHLADLPTKNPIISFLVLVFAAFVAFYNIWTKHKEFTREVKLKLERDVLWKAEKNIIVTVANSGRRAVFIKRVLVKSNCGCEISNPMAEAGYKFSEADPIIKIDFDLVYAKDFIKRMRADENNKSSKVKLHAIAIDSSDKKYYSNKISFKLKD